MSAPFDAARAAAWTGGRVAHGPGDRVLRGVSIDSRQCGREELFIAIRGPNHDGHQYLDAAVERGVAGLLVERDRPLPKPLPEGVCVVEVDDGTRALGALAAGHRGRFDGPVVAITGSNGKTTTKEMCAAILSLDGPCHRTPGNLNNEYGLPLTLLGRGCADRALVVEIGMNHRGEIAPLAAIARPTVGVITNVGTAHIEYLGSQEEIALEKGDLVAALAPDATAILNADDPLVVAQAARCRARVLTFGLSPSADVRAEKVREDSSGAGHAFELVAPQGRAAAVVHGLGETTVINALAAAAAALATGLAIDRVAQGLARHGPVHGRLERHLLARGIVLVDDTYNANPQSTEVALRLLARMKGENQGLAILGDMGELGASAELAHTEAGRLAGELGIDVLIALGAFAQRIADAAVAAGMQRSQVHVARDHEDASAAALDRLRDHDTVLVKGSRAMRMERVVQAIADAADPQRA